MLVLEVYYLSYFDVSYTIPDLARQYRSGFRSIKIGSERGDSLCRHRLFLVADAVALRGAPYLGVDT